MNGKNINFDNENIKKSNFYNKNKKIFNIDDINVNKILVSKKEQYGKYNSSKYFVGYNDNSVIRPLYLFLSQAIGYINKFDKIRMSLIIKDVQLLKSYNKIWKKKIEKLMKINFNTKTTYGDGDDQYIKTKIKTYKDNITTNFYNKKGSKKEVEEKIPHKCLSIIIIDSVLYVYEKDYLQTCLEECKYAKTSLKTNNYIDKELKLESDSDSDIYIEE